MACPALFKGTKIWIELAFSNVGCHLIVRVVTLKTGLKFVEVFNLLGPVL
jgi:hypothetical protein